MGLPTDRPATGWNPITRVSIKPRGIHEYRAILRNLLHQAATINYTPEVITVTLDRPDSPRVARSLELLAEELSALEAHMPGDPRPLAYQIA